MLRFLALASLAFAAAGIASAQVTEERAFGSLGDETEVETDAVDFILRPAQEPADEIDAFWENSSDPDESTLEEEIGPPLLGPDTGLPSGEEAIGPALAGPMPLVVERPVRARRAAEEDPFAATGIKLGSFILRPAIEIGVSASDNVASGREEEGAVGLVVAPELSIRSESERHEIEADLIGAAILYGDKEFDEREGAARVRARYDLTSRTSLNALASYSNDLDSYSDPDTPDAAVERPAVHEIEAALGVTQRFGKVSVGVAGSIERSTYEEVALAGGGTASREELNNTEYGMRVRTSYAASGAMTPFGEVGAGRREYEVEAQDDGAERSSFWGELRGGLIFDMGSKLSGEAALGVRREDLDGDDLEDLTAFIADASILWSPRRLTEIRFDFSTDVRPTGLAGASGSLLYSGVFTATRRVGARWRLEAGGGLDYETFVGVDREDVTLSAFAGLSYAFNRRASAVARYSYERTDSSDPDGDFDENVVGVRLRLQR